MRDLTMQIKPAALAIATVVLLAGCAIGPNYREPKVETQPGFAGGELVTVTPAAAVDAAWWRQFNDPLLNELVEQGLAANFSLAAADARLKSARASRREQFFDFLPTVTGTSSYNNIRQSRAGVPPGTPVLPRLRAV